MGTDNKDINSRVKEIMSVIRSRPNYLNAKESIDTLTKTVIEGNKLVRDSSNEELKSHPASSTVIFDFVKFILDFSYAIELKLVAVEFDDEHVKHVDTVLGYLDEILATLETLNEPPPDPSIQSKMKELLECVYWRKGALLYMLCHTCYHKPARYLDDVTKKHRFISHCRDGVIFLAQDMRRVRQEDALLEYVANDDQTLMLIKEGIFSDTNMLSIMYSAELSYWIHMYQEMYKLEVEMSFDARIIAEQLASQYIRIADGPLRDAKWDTSQARTIIRHCTHSL